MDTEEFYANKVVQARIKTDIQSLIDQADDEAWEGLTSFIQDKMDDNNCREMLLEIAQIWQKPMPFSPNMSAQFAEKYSLISDKFHALVDLIADRKMKNV